MRKKGKFLVETFFENAVYIWKYFVMNIRADSSYSPPLILKLHCSPTAMISLLLQISVSVSKSDIGRCLVRNSAGILFTLLRCKLGYNFGVVMIEKIQTFNFLLAHLDSDVTFVILFGLL